MQFFKIENTAHGCVGMAHTPHRIVVGVIYYHFEVCSSLPNYMSANNKLILLRPPFAKQVNSPNSSPGVRPLKMNNPMS